MRHRLIACNQIDQVVAFADIVLAISDSSTQTKSNMASDGQGVAQQHAVWRKEAHVQF